MCSVYRHSVEIARHKNDSLSTIVDMLWGMIPVPPTGINNNTGLSYSFEYIEHYVFASFCGNLYNVMKKQDQSNLSTGLSTSYQQ